MICRDFYPSNLKNVFDGKAKMAEPNPANRGFFTSELMLISKMKKSQIAGKKVAQILANCGFNKSFTNYLPCSLKSINS